MATAASPPPPALTFPRPIFAAVSPHPFLQAHLSADKSAIRANGRAAHEFRAPGVHTGSLTHCNGSAVVRLGNTSVVCGVRAEILREEDTPGTSAREVSSEEEDDEDADADADADADEIDALRLVVPNIELSTGSTPAHIPGAAPSTTQQALTTRLRTLLHSTRLLRARDLHITHTPAVNPEDPDAAPAAQLKGYWVLYLDVVFLSLDGGAFDAAWLSIVAALRHTRLPRAYFDDELDGILCSDAPAEASSLRLRGLPVASSFAVFEGRGAGEGEGEKGADWVLSDPDAFEEGVCREAVTITVHRGTVCRVEKSGGGVVGRETMKALVQRAVERWDVVEEAVNGRA
ncbi:exoribonuclease family protein [Didymella exigua CBS 183.55]|uniref:Ribosomal RNA-processing protein 43 n=1 Tax=Didymella exigua CBS 183.55 TaxID=1150837 RepID=A0A6A5RDP0_9PLEO|nr:exoribonuclease family protein [Didymella exigua CBS 183.55]KAF1925430.1 exoribonuclease family protein [Didymella exigua CBS 183.55]